MKLEHCITPCTKINSKWIKDLNIRPDTIKLLEENIGRTLFDIHCNNDFFESVSSGKGNKAKINKWNLIIKSLKTFAQQGNHQQNKNATY